MKRILIGDHRESLLATVETILRHLGYRVLVSSIPSRLTAFLQETSPDLMLFGAVLLRANPDLGQMLEKKSAETSAPLVILDENPEKEPLIPGHEVLSLPLDLFSLFAVVQHHLEDIPRQHLRLALRMPGMLCLGENCNLVQLLSLSRRGMFVKTSTRMNDDQPLKVIIPLMGMNRELEISGQILYRVHPTPDNNYLQGIGVGFPDLDDEAAQALDAFIAGRFFGDLDDNIQSGAKPFPEVGQGAATLRLAKHH